MFPFKHEGLGAMIKMNCHLCGNPIRVPEHAAGKNGNCKKCGTLLRIPELVNQESELDQKAEENQTGNRPKKDETSEVAVEVPIGNFIVATRVAIAIVILVCFFLLIRKPSNERASYSPEPSREEKLDNLFKEFGDEVRDEDFHGAAEKILEIEKLGY